MICILGHNANLAITKSNTTALLSCIKTGIFKPVVTSEVKLTSLGERGPIKTKEQFEH